MAISRDKKQDLVAKLNELFANAKSVACASYNGLSVADLQKLRAIARNQNVTIKVFKNRLVKVALSSDKRFKDTNTSSLTWQLIYAFSEDDEATPAQVLANFAKTNPALQLTIGFDNTGSLLDKTTISTLANLPSKDQLKGQLLSTLSAPLTGLLSVMGGNQRGFLRVLQQHSDTL